MSKFRVNDSVVVKATGEKGVVKSRDVIQLDENRIKVEYIVKLGEGLSNWKSFTKNELERVVRDVPTDNTLVKVYEAKDGYKVTMFATTDIEKDFSFNCLDKVLTLRSKRLRIGYSIYNPQDEYNEEMGVKIAKHRAKISPFCDITSSFTGEFNKETVEVLMDVKAKYIVEHLDTFARRV